MLDNMADTELGVAVGHPSDQHVQHGLVGGFNPFEKY